MAKDKKPKDKKKPAGLPLATLLDATPNEQTTFAQGVTVKQTKFTVSNRGFGVMMGKVKRKPDPKRPKDKPESHKCVVMQMAKNRYRVLCDCKRFMFYSEYALATYGASQITYSNGQPATTTNPNNVPMLCSHLYRLMASNSLMGRLDAVYKKEQKRLEKALR